MRHYLGLFFILACLWLLLSGSYSFHHTLVATMGLLSCLLVTWLSWRLDIHDKAWPHLNLHYAKLPGYTLWLMKEIILANWDVSQRIIKSLFGNHHSINPVVAKLICKQDSDLGRVIYANSITLTPGTISVCVDQDSILIHALSHEAAESLDNGDMGQRVSQLENGAPQREST